MSRRRAAIIRTRAKILGHPPFSSRDPSTEPSARLGRSSHHTDRRAREVRYRVRRFITHRARFDDGAPPRRRTTPRVARDATRVASLRRPVAESATRDARAARGGATPDDARDRSVRVTRRDGDARAARWRTRDARATRTRGRTRAGRRRDARGDRRRARGSGRRRDGDARRARRTRAREAETRGTRRATGARARRRG